MAIKPNESRKSEHTGFIGASGSGKTFAVRKLLKSLPDANVLVFDQYEVYSGFKYAKTIKELAGLVRSAIGAGKKYRFAYSGKEAGAFERFCRLVWCSANGDNQLITVWEEAGAYLGNASKQSEPWYELITVGRKYGVVVVPVVQRPQNLNKVVFDNLARVWIGYNDGRAQDYVESNYRIDLSVIKPESYEYYLKDVSGIKLMTKNDKPKK